MSTQRILVTGGAGFVGRLLLSRLTGSGNNVLAPPGPGRTGGVDLADATSCKEMVEAFRPTVIVHLAARSSVVGGETDPDGVWRDNFDATRNLASAAHRLGHPVHFVFASSAEVYGVAFNAGACAEDSAVMPVSSYGRTKAAAEMILRDMASSRLRVTVLRLFNHTGPGQDERFVIPSFAAQIARAERSKDSASIEVGNLEAQRDFTDVEDILDAYVLVVQGPEPKASYVVFNVGSGRTRRIGDVLNRLLQNAKCTISVRTAADRMRPSDIPIAAGNFAKFQSAYGWRPQRDLDDTLAAILDARRAAL
ncbi:GDP-mannose 4,6-dehydratase [Brevundimonas sp.]|uniref:NAD-dependent epimerase/dehydratase family protein n=1 Tax=Brevundimonas sp. TaxID=1871086 RepID=UPI0025C6E62A|nr:GDP-mannose 4,6-dehydratase [Brevundimonas sp.]